MSDEELLHDFHLNRPRFCQRLVRLRELTTDEVRAVENEASRNVGKDATMMQVRNETLRLGMIAMLVAVSPPMADPQKTDLKELTAQDKESPTSPFFFGKLFRAKDEAFLSKKWQDFHEITRDDVEAIEGKSSTVLKD